VRLVAYTSREGSECRSLLRHQGWHPSDGGCAANVRQNEQDTRCRAPTLAFLASGGRHAVAKRNVRSELLSIARGRPRYIRDTLIDPAIVRIRRVVLGPHRQANRIVPPADQGTLCRSRSHLPLIHAVRRQRHSVAYGA
jgi:hypothetical protein